MVNVSDDCLVFYIFPLENSKTGLEINWIFFFQKSGNPVAVEDKKE